MKNKIENNKINNKNSSCYKFFKNAYIFLLENYCSRLVRLRNVFKKLYLRRILLSEIKIENVNNKKSFRYKKRNSNSGFAILFAVVISSIILAITLGVAEISLKEIKFSTQAQQTNNAFFAADTGAECALFNDKSASKSFIQNGSTGTVICLDSSISLSGNYPSWTFILSKLGSAGKGCAIVTVKKSGLTTSVISKGYNNGGSTSGSCNKQDPNRVERELDLNY